MLRSLRMIFAAVILTVLPAGAQAQLKVLKHCLLEAEVTVEQLVRHGIFMREGANRCEPYVPGSAKKWKVFDNTFGARLKAQTDRRIKLFKREFGPDAVKVMTYFDGRLVTYHRHYPLSVSYCENVDDMLDGIAKGGWKSFTTQARTVQNEVLLDYKVCQ